MGHLIEVRGLRFQYPGGVPALLGVDFHLETTETVILLGANGSGKTTFLLHLAGLLAGEGEIRICGYSLTKDTVKEIRRRVGFVFQDSDDQLFMPTVLEDVCYGPLNMGMNLDAARVEAMEALRRVGLEKVADRAPYHLSAGEKRRASIAGILVMKPEILLLDEPTTSLDPPGQKELTAILSQLPIAKIVATHDTRFARAIGTRAVFFEGGTIRGEGQVEDLIRRFGWETISEA
jgi:cobalt/nickel transport system ATP-binding protein